jgi:2-dehydro-3-deoxygluconokinase
MVAGWQAEGSVSASCSGCPADCPGSTSSRPTTRASAASPTGATAPRPATSLLWNGHQLSRRRSRGTIFSITPGSRCRSMAGRGAPGCLRPSRARAPRGARIAFDTNFRPRGWPDRAVAREGYRLALARADFILASTEDLELLFGADAEVERFAASAEVVVKLAEPACRVLTRDGTVTITAEPVSRIVDTTAAGDSFAAAYLAARLSGIEPVGAARAGTAWPGWSCSTVAQSSRARRCRPAYSQSQSRRQAPNARTA